jgi:hypothetical protein
MHASGSKAANRETLRRWAVWPGPPEVKAGLDDAVPSLEWWSRAMPTIRRRRADHVKRPETAPAILLLGRQYRQKNEIKGRDGTHSWFRAKTL